MGDVGGFRMVLEGVRMGFGIKGVIRVILYLAIFRSGVAFLSCC